MLTVHAYQVQPSKVVYLVFLDQTAMWGKGEVILPGPETKQPVGGYLARLTGFSSAVSGFHLVVGLCLDGNTSEPMCRWWGRRRRRNHHESEKSLLHEETGPASG